MRKRFFKKACSLIVFCVFSTMLALPFAHAGNQVQETIITDTVPTNSFSDLLSAMQTRYDAMQSCSASFRQVLSHRQSETSQEQDGQLQWRKPLLVRWETQGMNPELLIVGKDSIWNYFPDEELAYRYPLDLVKDSMAIINVVTGQSRLEHDFNVIDEGTEKMDNGVTLARLHLYPKEPTQNFTEAMLWLDMASHLIHRVIIYDFYGNENDVTFTHTDVDAIIPHDMMDFIPPQGTEVLDQRAGLQ